MLTPGTLAPGMFPPGVLTPLMPAPSAMSPVVGKGWRRDTDSHGSNQTRHHQPAHTHRNLLSAALLLPETQDGRPQWRFSGGIKAIFASSRRRKALK
jgi:hypothetical protein